MFPEKPEAGLVLHYAFLWRHEAEQGRDEGGKDRPVIVIVLMADGEEVVVAPITTRPPAPGALALEIPARVRAHLGLTAQCWVSIAALNRFVWPGPDLRPVPGRSPSTSIYGYVPRRLLDAVRELAMNELSRKNPGLAIRRSRS